MGRPKVTRRIRSHKGGRTARAPEARMTPQERGRLDAVLKRRGVRYVDWLVDHVNADYADYAEIIGENEMSDYHPDPKVNRNCQRIIDELRVHPAKIGELAKSLMMNGYDVTVAVGALSARGKVAKYGLGHFRVTEE